MMTIFVDLKIKHLIQFTNLIIKIMINAHVDDNFTIFAFPDET